MSEEFLAIIIFLFLIIYFFLGISTMVEIFTDRYEEDYTLKQIIYNITINHILLIILFVPHLVVAIIVKLIINIVDFISDLDFMNIPLSDIFKKNK